MTQPPPNQNVPEEGSRVGPWLVQERMGSGSHGVVFRVVRADQPRAGTFALKLAREAGDARFEREAVLLSRIDHSSVVRFEDKGFWTSPRGDHYPYVVMQWVEGVSLYDWATVHGLTLRQAIGQLAQLARALEATHVHGLHRDVKGGNVRVDDDGHVVLLDFGSCSYEDATPLTGRALPPGTEQYRSPQLLFLRFALSVGVDEEPKAGPEDDVYALGVTAYRLLASSYPPIPDEKARGPLRLEPPRGVADRCPELSALVMRMLSEDPGARGSARKVAEELERLLGHGNPMLDRIWVEGSKSMEPTEKTRRLTRHRSVLAGCLPELAFSAAFVVVCGLVLWLARNGPRHEVASAEEPRSARQWTGSPDAGPVGMGDGAMASVSPVETPTIGGRGITRKMPDEPVPGQKRRPCTERGEIEINGGCWWMIEGAAKPPCGGGKYEHEGLCYAPVLKLVERTPTSDDPP